MTDILRREALAKALCERAGGQWDAPRHKRGHWRKKAQKILDAQAPVPAGWWPKWLTVWLR